MAPQAMRKMLLTAGGVTNQVSLTGPTTATDGGTSTAQEPWLTAQPSISTTISGSSQMASSGFSTRMSVEPMSTLPWSGKKMQMRPSSFS